MDAAGTPDGLSSGTIPSAGQIAPAAEREAPRSGAPAGIAAQPLLDNECGNVPRGTWIPSWPRKSWSRKQWLTRRAVIDRLRYWQANGYQCLWVTLTSSPSSPTMRLRRDFQALRKRVGRDLGYQDFEYVCVDTREGHGVLHMIWAWRDPNPRKRVSFYVPFKWLQEQWQGLHGAFHVNVKRIGGADRDARRLSRYIVAQYCGDQNALVRLSQSRMEVSLSKMRDGLLRALRGLPERYVDAGSYRQGLPLDAFGIEFGRRFWAVFRGAWYALVRSRSFEAFGVQFVWWCGELQRV